MEKRRMWVLALLSAFLLTGCAGMTAGEQRILGGGALGAATGAGIGAATGGDPGVGAAIGGAAGVVGGAISNQIERERGYHRDTDRGSYDRDRHDDRTYEGRDRYFHDRDRPRDDDRYPLYRERRFHEERSYDSEE